MSDCGQRRTLPAFSVPAPGDWPMLHRVDVAAVRVGKGGIRATRVLHVVDEETRMTDEQALPFSQ